MKKKEIRELYFNYVVDHKKPPRSLKAFLKKASIEKDTFKKKYNNLKEVEADIWKHALKDTLTSLEESVEFAQYSSKDKGLALIYSWFECMDLNKCFFKNCSLMKMGPMTAQNHLKRFKKDLRKFIKKLIKKGKSMSEFKDRGLPEKMNCDLFWALFCMNLSSWKNNGSKKAKKRAEEWMDAMIEKSMIFFFESLAPNIFDTLIDLLKHHRSKK